MAVAAGRRRTLLIITSYGLVRKNCHGKFTTTTRAIDDDATAVLRMFSDGRGTRIPPQKLEVSEFCSIFLLAVRISSSSDQALRSLLLRVPREFIPGPRSCRESSIVNQARQKLISRIRISVVTPSQGSMTTSNPYFAHL